MATDGKIVPFHTYIWKIASRCNLNCDYCYVYNSVDKSWQDQPRYMSVDSARATVRRMREHIITHDKDSISIIFHGGEPLLVGVDRLRALLDIIRVGFRGTDVHPSVGIQSNGLLFDDEVGRYLIENGMSIGVSIDGPAHINDRHRIDHVGAPTSARLEERLRLLTSRYASVFSGFLCVIDIETDPVEVLDYLASWAPPSIDFLLPLDNHDRRPRGKDRERERDVAPYGSWLVRAFDRWCELSNPPDVRIFKSIARMLCGGDTTFEALGLLPVDLIVVESDGSIEAVDSLRTTYAGATKLGFNVFDNTFDEAASHVAVRARQLGSLTLSATCQRCSLVEVCGGGYLPHRWSAERGFDNPSVYCTDLQMIIRHIDARLRGALAPIMDSALLTMNSASAKNARL